ncbi:DUF6705 family protein [Flavobacterium qiangtangense]|uniref:DUF6705 family protein n=1 Tax=Flavobacterium qiangtangense TaxID=1442595 RepID=A0ABW1PPC0_9FLAO
MKKLLYISISILSLSCKAQNPVYDITDLQHRVEDIHGAYYKDINNLLNPFEGTYIFEKNENSLFKIVLQKKIMSSMNGYLFEDLIIGEYQYIENGLEKVNTLNKLEIYDSNKRNHSIDGNLIITLGSVGCNDCQPGEKAIRGGLVDGSSNYTADLIIRRMIVNGQSAIKIWVGWRTGTSIYGQPAPASPSFKGTYYTLIKQ